MKLPSKMKPSRSVRDLMRLEQLWAFSVLRVSGLGSGSWKMRESRHLRQVLLSLYKGAGECGPEMPRLRL